MDPLGLRPCEDDYRFGTTTVDPQVSRALDQLGTCFAHIDLTLRRCVDTHPFEWVDPATYTGGTVPVPVNSWGTTREEALNYYAEAITSCVNGYPEPRFESLLSTWSGGRYCGQWDEGCDLFTDEGCRAASTFSPLTIGGAIFSAGTEGSGWWLKRATGRVPGVGVQIAGRSVLMLGATAAVVHVWCVGAGVDY